jgi:hypothetical protein
MSQIVGNFMASSDATDMRWYADADTEEIVGFCPSCGAELRISMKGGSVLFTHHDGCPCGHEERAQQLVEEMLKVLEEETDAPVVLSAAALLSAMRCVAVAEDCGVSPDVVAENFVSVFQQRVGEVGQVREILAARENAV